MNNAHKLFEEYLIKHKSRLTHQKAAILDEIISIGSHFEIDAFIKKLTTKNKKDVISRATIFRTIKQLLDAKLIQKITTRTGKVYYEETISRDHHAHLICNSCGKIFEIQDKSLEEQLNTYCKKLKFTPKYHSIHLYAECNNEYCTHSKI
tara:strand:+ start:2686 stop:3135 length:450 start_codon:yes stop_codon:yes gene_type:complete